MISFSENIAECEKLIAQIDAARRRILFIAIILTIIHIILWSTELYCFLLLG